MVTLADMPRTLQDRLDALRESFEAQADPAKLRMLMEENDALTEAGRRSPASGWGYLKYLHPDQTE